jgi:hypothetical protein
VCLTAATLFLGQTPSEARKVRETSTKGKQTREHKRAISVNSIRGYLICISSKSGLQLVSAFRKIRSGRTYKFDTAFGVALQLGGIYNINEQWFANVSVTKSHLKTTTKFQRAKRLI